MATAGVELVLGGEQARGEVAAVGVEQFLVRCQGGGGGRRRVREGDGAFTGEFNACLLVQCWFTEFMHLISCLLVHRVHAFNVLSIGSLLDFFHDSMLDFFLHEF